MFRKRFIALVMALTMLFTLMAPALTFATGAGSEEETTGTGTSEVTEETNEQGSDTDPDEGGDDQLSDNDGQGGDDQPDGDLSGNEQPDNGQNNNDQADKRNGGTKAPQPQSNVAEILYLGEYASYTETYDDLATALEEAGGSHTEDGVTYGPLDTSVTLLSGTALNRGVSLHGTIMLDINNKRLTLGDGFGITSGTLVISGTGSLSGTDEQIALLSFADGFYYENGQVKQGYRYTVTFVTGDDAVPAPDAQTVAYGLKAERPEDPERTGYTFEGWKDEHGYVWNFIEDAVYENKVLTAQWTAKTFTIKFADDGGLPAAPVTATYDQAATLGTAARYGFAFAGWKLDDATYGAELSAAEVNALFLAADENDGEVTLTADWVAAVASVNDVFYASFAEAAAARTDNDADVITLLADVDNEAYILGTNETLKVKKDGHKLTVKAPEGYFLSDQTDAGVTTYTVTPAVAKIEREGETLYFATIQEAVEAVKAAGYNNCAYTLYADPTAALQVVDPDAHLIGVEQGDGTWKIVVVVARVADAEGFAVANATDYIDWNEAYTAALNYENHDTGKVFIPLQDGEITLNDDEYVNVYTLEGVTLKINAQKACLPAALKAEANAAEYTRYSVAEAVASVTHDEAVTYYETLGDAIAVAEAGDTVTILVAGTYTLPNLPKNITLEGAVDGVEFSHTVAGSIASIPNGATFENVAFTFGNVDYHGFQHAGTINMIGCTLNGKLFSYGNMIFTDCAFVQTNSDYHMWVYGGDTITYDNCTFINETKGKFLNVYCENSNLHTLYVNDCTFINRGSESSKAAINIKETSGGSTPLNYTVHISGCVIDGLFPENSEGNSLVVGANGLWQVDDRLTNGTETKLLVYLENELVYPKYVAEVSNGMTTKGYTTLQAAIDAAQQLGGEVTVNLLADISESVTINEVANFKLTIDGAKEGGGRYTITDATLTIDGKRTSGGSINNGAAVTLQNIDFVKSADTSAAVKAGNTYPHDVTIQNCSFIGTDNNNEWWAIDTSGDASYYWTLKDLTFAKCRMLTSKAFNFYGRDAEQYPYGLYANNLTGTDVYAGINNTKTDNAILIENCTISTGKYAFRDAPEAYTGTITLRNNTFTSTSTASDEGALYIRGGAATASVSVESGTYTGQVLTKSGFEHTLNISGGTFINEAAEDSSYIDPYVVTNKAAVKITDHTWRIDDAVARLVAEADPFDPEGAGVSYGAFAAAYADAQKAENSDKVLVLLTDDDGEAKYVFEAGMTQKVYMVEGVTKFNYEPETEMVLVTSDPATPAAGTIVTYTAAGAVAKIGDVLYDTLAGAIEAVQSNETIVILKDLDCTGLTITLPDGVTGVTIKGEDPDNYVTLTDLTGMAKTNSDLTFENIKFLQNSKTLTMRGSNIAFDHCTFTTETKAADPITSIKDANDFAFSYCDFIGKDRYHYLVGDKSSCTNISIDYCNFVDGWSGIYYGNLKGEVRITNSIFNVKVYTNHTGTGGALGSTSLYCENNEYWGWTSYGQEVSPATFKNCIFHYQESGYNYVKPSAPKTTFEGCVFEEGVKVETQSRIINTFKECYMLVDGQQVLVTAANISSLNSDDTAGDVIVPVAAVEGIYFYSNYKEPDMTEAVDAAYAASEFAAGTYTFYCDPNPVFEAKDEYKGKYAAYQDETTKTWIVYKLVTGINLAPTELVFIKGDTETKTLTATIVPDEALNKEIVWTSSDETVATVDENGVVTPVGQGTATITVALKAQPDMKAEATVVVAVAKIEKDGETTYYPTLQAAVTAAHEMNDEVTVTLLADVTEVVVIHQKAGLNLTVDGDGKTITGQFYVDGDGRYEGADTLTIQNVKFAYDAATYDDAFINVPSTKTAGKPYTTGNYNYAHNVTVRNCEFTGEGTTTVAVRVASGAGANKVTLSGLTVTGGHSFAQLVGVKDLTITGCTATGVKNGINISGGDGTGTISGNTLTAEGYTVRLKDASGMAVTLSDNTFSGSEGIVSNATGGGTIKIESGSYIGLLNGAIAITGGQYKNVSDEAGELEKANPSPYVDLTKYAVVRTLIDVVEWYVLDTAIVVRYDASGEPVASYTSLEAAFADPDITDTDTIKPLKDIEVAQMINVTKTVTLDLDGHKVSRNNGGSIVMIKDGATLTIDGTKENSEIYGRINVGTSGNNNGSVVLNGGYYHCCSGETVLHVNGECLNSNVTIKNAKVTSPDDNGIQLNGKGTHVIENSTISGKTAVYIKAGTVTVTGSTLESTAAAHTDYNFYNNGSNPTGDAVVIDVCGYPGGDPSVAFGDGNTIKVAEDSGNLQIGYYEKEEKETPAVVTAKDNTLTVPKDYKWVETETAGVYKLTKKVYVAEIVGGEKYETLVEAVKAVPTDGTETTVKLLADIAGENVAFNGGRNIVLDMDRHTLTPANAYVLNGQLKLMNGTVENTVWVYGLDTDDSSMTSKLTVDATATIEATYAIVLSNMKGTANCYDAEIEVNGTLNGNVWVMGNILEGDSVINVNDGAKITADGTAIALNGNAIVNVYEGATVTGETGIEVRAGELNVTGGTITATGTFTEDANGSGTTTTGVAVAISQHTTNLPITVTINSGTLKGEKALYEVDLEDETTENVTVAVTGGYFTGKVGSENLKGFITQGHFSEEPEASYIIPGKCAVQEDEWWIVGDAVAAIGDVGYASLAKAVVASKDNDVIKMLKNDTVASYIEVRKDVTLDLNGKTVTAVGGGLDAYGKLTITDNSENKDGKLDAGRWGVWANAGAEVTVENGTIEAGEFAIVADGTGKVVVNGGTITAGNTGINLNNNATATVDGGSVSGKWGITAFDNASLTVNNGTVTGGEDGGAISTNGTAGNHATIVVNGGTITNEHDLGIYMPSGNLTVNGGTITGTTAVYVKSGKTTITGGTLHGTGEKTDYSYYGNGGNPTGDALVVDNCGYPNGDPVVEITGGTFTSDKAKGVGAYYDKTNRNELSLVTSTDKTITVLENQMWIETDTAGVYKLVEAVVVTFVTEDGIQAPEAQRIEKGTKATRPNDLTKDNYIFLGWFADGAETAFDFENTTVTEDITLTAKFEGNPIRIIYANYFTDDIIEEFNVHYGDPKSMYTISQAAIESIPEREGYHFDLNDMWTIPVAETATKNVVYVLKWIKGLTVQFVYDNGTDPLSVDVDQYSTVDQPEDPTKKGYDFAGWFNGKNEYEFSTPVTASIILTAHWTPKKMTVTFNTNGGSEIDAVQVDYDTAVDEPIAPTKENYVFAGWTLDGEQYNFEAAVKSDITLVAQWTEAVAKIGNAYYTTLEEAFEAAKTGETVVLLKNIEQVNPISVGKKVTLDLDGKTITYATTAAGKADYVQLITVESTGDLTITGEGKIAGPANGQNFDSKALITVDGGKLTIENGTLTATGEGSDGMYGVYVLNGGTAVFGTEDGNGPTITSHFAAIGTNNTTAPATITVNGGTYTANAAPTNNEWWSYFCAPIYAASNGTYTLNGGTFNGYYGISSRYNNVDQDVKLYDVTINASSGTQVFVDEKVGTANTADRLIWSETNTLSVPEGYIWIDYEGGYKLVLGVTVTFVNDDEVVTKQIEKGTKVEKPDDPTREGYTFNMWTLNGAEYDFDQLVTENITLVATWRKNVTVTADNAGKTYGDPEPDEFTVTIEGLNEGDTVLYTVARAEGEDVGEYVITVSGDTVQGDYAVTFVSGKFTITAKTQYTIMYIDDDGTILQISPAEAGAATPAFTGEIPERVGYGYREDDMWTTEVEPTVTASRIYILKRVKIHTVTFMVDEAQYGDSLQVFDGDTIPVANKPADPTAEGTVFAGWFDDNNAFIFGTTQVISDLTLTAKWINPRITYSLVLEDSIDIRLYVRDLMPGTDPDDYSVTYSFNGSETTKALYDMDSNMFTIARCAARRMTDKVHVVVKYNDTVIKEEDYSVQSYCLYVINNPDFQNDVSKKPLIDLCKATLDYGRYAQERFNYKTDDLANGGTDYAPINNPISGTVVTGGQTTSSGSCEGIRIGGWALSLESRTELYIYFNHDSGTALDNYEFKVNGQSIQASEPNGTQYLIVIAGIAAKELDQDLIITATKKGEATGITLTTSPVSYMSIYAEDPEEGTLFKAAYNYHLAAKAYFE